MISGVAMIAFGFVNFSDFANSSPRVRDTESGPTRTTGSDMNFVSWIVCPVAMIRCFSKYKLGLWSVVVLLYYVLSLLAGLFNFDFDIDRIGANLRIGAFGADGIYLAGEFLEGKVKAFAFF